jgi:hypothetical protein
MDFTTADYEKFINVGPNFSLQWTFKSYYFLSFGVVLEENIYYFNRVLKDSSLCSMFDKLALSSSVSIKAIYCKDWIQKQIEPDIKEIFKIQNNAILLTAFFILKNLVIVIKYVFYIHIW